MNHQHGEAGPGNRALALVKRPEELAGIEELNLDGCRLVNLPKEIGLLTHLRTLGLYDNGLRRLPKSVWRLEQLVT